MRDFSDSSGRVFILDARPSRALALWWLGLHLLLSLTVLMLDVDAVSSAVALLVLAAHAGARFPTSRIVLSKAGDGRWSIPARGLIDLRLTSGTCFSPLWARLVFGAKHGATAVLLLRDQLDAEDWRRLQAAVREPQG